MATIVTRAGKGSPLTSPEVDSNFNNLNTDISTINTKLIAFDPTTNASFTKDANGNINGFTDAAGNTIKVSGVLYNDTNRYWMPYAGTWACDGTTGVVTGNVSTGHLYAVGDKMIVPPIGSGSTQSTGTGFPPSGIWTITASATPTFSMTRDVSPSGVLAVGTGSFDGTTQVSSPALFNIPANTLGINDNLVGYLQFYYGSGSTTAKIGRFGAVGGQQTVVASESSSGVSVGKCNWRLGNMGVLNKQKGVQAFTVGQQEGSFGAGTGIYINDFGAVTSWQILMSKTTGTDAMAIDMIRVILERT